MPTVDRARFVLPSGATWREPWGMYAALRDHDPLHHVADGDYWVLSRFDDVFSAARDTEVFSSAEGLTTTYGEREAIGLDFAPMVMLDPPDHTAFRRLVSRGFTPRAVATIADDVRAFVVERIEGLRADGGGDLVEALAKPLPSFVVAHYLGVPEADRSRFDAWTEAIVGSTSGGDHEVGAAAVMELAGYFAELVERRRVEPGEDVTSELVQATRDDEEIPVMEILGFAFTMVAGGNDTVTGLLGGAAELLTDRRDERRRLLDDPSLLPSALEELLRLTSPVQGLARTTTRDVELHGHTIAAGRKVLLLYGSANRDERRFGPDAGDLDVGRDPHQILTFGSGAHHCLGAAAARLQGRIALEELLARCPDFTVDAGAGTFASGHHVRRHESLPFTAGG